MSVHGIAKIAPAKDSEDFYYDTYLSWPHLPSARILFPENLAPQTHYLNQNQGAHLGYFCRLCL